MPKRSSRAKDPIQTAFDVLQKVISLTEQAEEQNQKNPAAVALGRKGGLRGGPARRAALSAARRREIALKAAQTRWKGRKAQK